MKTIFKIMTVLLGFIVMSSCTTQNIEKFAAVESLLQQGEFTFVAERANPTNPEVVKVMASIPGNNSSKMLNLDSGYTIEIRTDELEVTLPYFGKMYTENIEPDKKIYQITAEDFATKDFTINKKDGKKGSTVFNIVANDQQNIKKMNMEVFKNGKAHVWVDSNDKQSISYDGYITTNLITKK